MTEQGPSGQGPRGTTPGEALKGSEGRSEVMCEEDEERLGRAPRGTTTQMAMRGNKRGSWCRGAGQGMGTTTAGDILKVCV